MLRLNELKREQGAVTSPRDGARSIFIVCGATRREAAHAQVPSRRTKSARDRRGVRGGDSAA
jgi:hypothetical protein